MAQSDGGQSHLRCGRSLLCGLSPTQARGVGGFPFPIRHIKIPIHHCLIELNTSSVKGTRK